MLSDISQLLNHGLSRSALILGEAALGLWLLSGVAPRAARISALLVFMIFAMVSFAAGVAGRATCGCLGAIALSPWWTFVIDLAAIAALCIVLKTGPMHATMLGQLNSWVASGGMLLLAGLLGTMLVYQVTLDGAVARWTNEPLRIEPRFIDLGTGPADSGVTIPIEVANHADRDVELIGSSSSCSCAVLGGVPRTLPRGARITLEIQGKFGAVPGPFEQRLDLFTDHPQQTKIVIRFGGTSVQP
ncbi:MAG: hypothetical protein ACRCZF_24920 [Gemmataceae bacterium]